MWRLAVDSASDLHMYLPVGKETWSPVQAAVHVGRTLRERLILPVVTAPSPFCLPKRGGGGGGSVPSSPSGRRRRSAGVGVRSSILGSGPLPQTGAAAGSGTPPSRPSAKRRGGVSIEDIDQLTPSSLREVAKRLCAERDAAGGAPRASPVSRSTDIGGRGEGSRAAASAGTSERVTIPPFPSLHPATSPRTPGGDSGGSASQGGCYTPAVSGSGRAGATVGSGAVEAGVKLSGADEEHGGNLSPFFPGSAADEDIVVWVDQLARAGLPAAADHFMNASGAASLGVTPEAGTPLQAEMMVEQVSAMMVDLRAQGALPPRLRGDQCSPVDWREAARNARMLLSAYTTAFRARKGGRSAGVVEDALQESAAGGKVKDKPPADSFEVVEVASKAAERQLAVPADVLHGVTALATLQREHLRPSAFKDLTMSSHQQREDELEGELRYLVGQYGQGAGAYLASNGMSLGKVRGAGVPTALAGVRGHLERRAQSWVEAAFGRERASDTQFVSEAYRLRLSVLTGVVAGDSPEVAESVVVRLLGGSKPNEMADVRREGGSVSEGTLGSLTGDAAHFSIRAAYQLWAQGVARCLGPVLLAARATEAEAEVLGEHRDFDLQSNLLRIPHTMSVEGLRSTCRHFSRKLSFAMQAYRSCPGERLPDVRAVAAEMGGPVLERRLQDAEYERKSGEHLARMQEGFERRVRALEDRSSQRRSAAPAAPRGVAASVPALPGDGRQPRISGRDSGRRFESRGSAAPTDAARASAGPAPGGVGSSGGPERDPQGDGKLRSRMQAVRALQEAVRARLGLPVDKSAGKSEPCAWLAITGRCTKSECEACAGKLPMPADLLASVRARCHDRVLRVKPSSKDPG